LSVSLSAVWHDKSMRFYKIKLFFSPFINVIFPERRSAKRRDFDFAAITPDKLAQKLPRASGLPRELAENRIAACLSYRDPLVRTLVWRIKTKRDRHAFVCGAYILREKLKQMRIAGESSVPIVIPMPIHRKRLRERGYNQCELLARKIKNLDIEIRTDILFRKYRKENAKKQAFKNRSERHTGMKGVFYANVSAIEKIQDLSTRRIIVLDDVLTTGSTMNEAILTLQKAGCKNVSGLALAH